MEENKILATIEKMFDKKLEPFESLLERKLGSIVKRLDNMQWHIAKIQDIEKSISFLSDKFDETVGRISRLEEENETLRNENRCLRAEVHRTTNLMAQLKDDVNDLQQYSRGDRLEIRGLPVLEEEDTNQWVKRVGQLIDVEVNDDDIPTSHRLPPPKTTFGDARSKEPAIIVKLLKTRSSGRIIFS